MSSFWCACGLFPLWKATALCWIFGVHTDQRSRDSSGTGWYVLIKVPLHTHTQAPSNSHLKYIYILKFIKIFSRISVNYVHSILLLQFTLSCIIKLLHYKSWIPVPLMIDSRVNHIRVRRSGLSLWFCSPLGLPRGETHGSIVQLLSLISL